jgi:hypothetical protein
MPGVPRLIGAWVVVIAAAGAALETLDRVPAWLLGTPHGVRVLASVEEAESTLGARLWMPGYYPDELAWPPMRIDASGLGPVTVAVRIRGRADGAERLTVVQSLGGASPAPEDLLPRGQPMASSPVQVGAHEGTLVRLLLDTRELHDVSWAQGGRHITVRFTGPVDQLLLIARSLERRARETENGQR